MLDIDCLIALIDNFEHAYWLDLEWYYRKDKLSSIEKEDRILALSFDFYFCLLDVISFVPIVD